MVKVLHKQIWVSGITVKTKCLLSKHRRLNRLKSIILAIILSNLKMFQLNVERSFKSTLVICLQSTKTSFINILLHFLKVLCYALMINLLKQTNNWHQECKKLLVVNNRFQKQVIRNQFLHRQVQVVEVILHNYVLLDKVLVHLLLQRLTQLLMLLHIIGLLLTIHAKRYLIFKTKKVKPKSSLILLLENLLKWTSTQALLVTKWWFWCLFENNNIIIYNKKFINLIQLFLE